MRHFAGLLCLCLVVPTFLLAQVQYDHTVYTFDDATSATTADFNRDGRPDMAVGNLSGVHVLFNTGAGAFGSDVFYASTAAGTVIAADVNDDGWPDLVNNGSSTVDGLRRISILLNNKNGTFRAGSTFATNDNVGRVYAADLNHDGHVDLVAVESHFVAGAARGQLQIFKGNGTGTFTPGQILALSGPTSKIEIEDFDSDGNLDIVNVVSSKAVLWWGKGDGTFGTPTFIPDPDPDGLFSIASNDFNNDGVPDIAIAASHHCPDDPNHLCGTNTVYVYRNNGHRSFSRVSHFDMGLTDGGALYAVDIDGDQNADLAVAQGGFQVGNFDYASGHGNGTFADPVFVTELENSFLLFRDLDLDSRHDFINVNDIFQEVVVNLARSGFRNCDPPGSGALHSKICMPSADTVTSPVLVQASGNSPVGIRRLEVWIDGKKMFQRFNDQVSKRFSLAPGTHRIAIVAVDRDRGTATTAKQVTVR